MIGILLSYFDDSPYHPIPVHGNRHLCVCESCLVFIDKCPVCRAAFEEYITIKPEGSPVPALAPALPIFNGPPHSAADPHTPHTDAGGVTPHETTVTI